ncbi:MAG: aminomethyl-transferring glycine dehydrogenase subunit GcvPA [Candidatus Dormibacteria bacterium]
MAYLPNSDDERRQMLDAVGAGSVTDLFSAVPAALLKPPLELPPPLGEQELVATVSALAARNRPLSGWDAFLGAGVYHRFSPAIVLGTISRPEFYTAYTPYQAEASQGTLQTIFEFQTMICALTGLDVANASLYDGATAAAEALMLAVAHTGRSRVAVSRGVHPETRRVIATYAQGRAVGVDWVEPEAGSTTVAGARAVLTDQHAALLVAQPSFQGTVDDLRPLVEAAHAVGALGVAAVDPIACTVLASPGETGVDVAVGDGQPLGIPAQFGGPHVGFMAVRQTLLRRLPGRLVGLTVDHAGDRAYTLTLQTREQHIRREKATSNICTNHALMALAATAYMAHMGAGGMSRVAEVSARRAHALAERLAALPGFALAYPEQPFLWEFTLRCPTDARSMVERLRERGIIAGLPLVEVDAGAADHLLVCCTELTPPDAISRYVDAAADMARVATGSPA